MTTAAAPAVALSLLRPMNWPSSAFLSDLHGLAGDIAPFDTDPLSLELNHQIDAAAAAHPFIGTLSSPVGSPVSSSVLPMTDATAVIGHLSVSGLPVTTSSSISPPRSPADPTIPMAGSPPTSIPIEHHQHRHHPHPSHPSQLQNQHSQLPGHHHHHHHHHNASLQTHHHNPFAMSGTELTIAADAWLNPFEPHSAVSVADQAMFAQLPAFVQPGMGIHGPSGPGCNSGPVPLVLPQNPAQFGPLGLGSLTDPLDLSTSLMQTPIQLSSISLDSPLSGVPAGMTMPFMMAPPQQQPPPPPPSHSLSHSQSQPLQPLSVSTLTYDNLMAPMSTHNNSPDLSPSMVDCSQQGVPFDTRASKRQRYSKSISISPNLYPDSASRSIGKPGRHESAEAEDRKGQCPIPECGRVFKDLKAHMLTHQTERPEKCPIPTCEYHFKGFARKYDKNRHTLTHYRGTMVCIFCPGTGSAAEQTFNRVDAFKKHLTVSHGVEQAPPNSRKRNSSGRPVVPTTESANGSAVSSAVVSLVDGSGPRSDAACSTCSVDFHSPQEFYEHLDDCVLRVVQKLDPTEMHNERNLVAVAEDDVVVQTLARHQLPTDVDASALFDDDGDDNSSDVGRDGPDCGLRPRQPGPAGMVKRPMGGPLLGAPVGSNRKRRRNYPTSWGCPADRMNIRKRVMCVYDGQDRLCKDNMILDREYEVRVKLADGKSYVTDLDMQMLTRAEDLLTTRVGDEVVGGPVQMPAMMPADVFVDPAGYAGPDDSTLYIS